MRKIFLLSALLLSIIITSNAQSIELYPFAGYTFGTHCYVATGKARLSDGFTYGGTLSFVAGQHNSLELTYLRQDATATAEGLYSGFQKFSDPVSINYIFLGGSRLYPVNDKLTPFTGAHVGMAILGSKHDTFSNIEKLAFGVDVGVKIMVSDKVGIRLQSNLNMPVTNVGAGLWWSSGSGSSVGVTGNIPFVQFGFTGGLILKMK
jgi:hypothetical protein